MTYYIDTGSMVIQGNWRVEMADKTVTVNGVQITLKDNIGGWCRYYLIKGELTNKEIVEKVRARFNSKTSLASIAWYKDDLVQKGIFTKGQRGGKAMTLDDFTEAEAEAEAE